VSDPYQIDDIAGLRAIIGEEIPGIGDKNLPELDDYAKAFIAKSPFLILSTSSSEGRLDASPKGDAPGFVYVANDSEIVIPDRQGNKLAYGHLNVLDNPHVGVLMLIPGTRETLRINGRACLTADPALLEMLTAREKPATLAIRVQIEEVFFHCAKAFIRSGLWLHDEWPEPHKVSFGEMYTQRKKQSKELAARIDAGIEADYADNL
jgi:PPOX class probable FMN-dependent enzyme